MSWYGSEKEPSDAPPDWWLRLLDTVASPTLFQEISQSADSVCTLRKVPVYQRALAWARAEPPPPLTTAPSSQTLNRLKANSAIRAASEAGKTITVSSREPDDVAAELRDEVLQANTMPIARPSQWLRLHVDADVLCHVCPRIVPFEDRHAVVLSKDITRLYCSPECCDADAVTYAAESRCNMERAARIVDKWRRRSSWPFCVIAVNEGGKTRSLPLDIRVALGMSCFVGRTNLSTGLDADECDFIDRCWMLAQNLTHDRIFEEQSLRKRAELHEIERCKVHGMLQKAVERARDARAAAANVSEA